MKLGQNDSASSGRSGADFNSSNLFTTMKFLQKEVHNIIIITIKE